MYTYLFKNKHATHKLFLQYYNSNENRKRLNTSEFDCERELYLS